MDVLSASVGDDKIAWYENMNGLGSFGAEQIISNVVNGASFVFAADIDGDNDMDVFSGAIYDDKIKWFENTDGLGNFGGEQIIDNNAYGASSIYTGDIDSDGDIDLVSSVEDLSRTSWYRNVDGLGSFSNPLTVSSSVLNSNKVLACDIDEDGDMDVVTPTSWYENMDGLGEFVNQHLISISNTKDIYIADLDNDGDKDLVSGNYSNINGSAWLYYYINLDGQGNFQKQFVSNEVIWLNTVFASDLDGDGYMDILSASSYSNKVSWHKNLEGNFILNNPYPITSGNQVSKNSMYPCDIDGDGDMDVLTMHIGSASDFGIYWQENNGQGGFSLGQVLDSNNANSNYVNSVYSSDLDGDGDMDIISSFDVYDKIVWYENLDGLGTFGSQRIIFNQGYWSSPATSVYSEDLDGDGDIDIISSSENDNTIVWYENTDGLGNFSEQQIINENVENPKSVYAIDMDNDGDIDVLSASDEKIAWYENLGFTSLIANQPSDIHMCDNDNNGFAEFDLTVTGPEIIGGQDPTNLEVTYYLTQSDANNAINTIANPDSYFNTVNPQTIYARLEDNSNGDFDITDFDLIVYNSPETNVVSDYVILDVNNDGMEIFDLTTKIPEILNGQSDIEVTFYETQQDAVDDINAIASPTTYTNITNPQTIFTRLENLVNCYSVGSFEIFADPGPDPFVFIPDTNFKNALLNYNPVIDTNNDGEIQVSEAEAVFGLNVSDKSITSMVGVHSFINLTSLDCSLNQLTSLNISNGYNTNIINFNATDNTELFCIQVDDANYANSAPNWIKDTWASYSEDCNLGVEDNVLNDFNLYPNPAQDVLFIESQLPIEVVKIYNLQGQLIKEGTTDSVDVSNFSEGMYFVQVTIEGKSITKKFIKN